MRTLFIPLLVVANWVAIDAPGQALQELIVRAEFVVEPIDPICLDLSLGNLQLGLQGTDLDQREAFMDQLVNRLRIRDIESEKVRRWLEGNTRRQGELAWTSRWVMRDVKRFESQTLVKRDPFAALLLGSNENIFQVAMGVETQSNVALGSPFDTWFKSPSGKFKRFPLSKDAEEEEHQVELFLGHDNVRVRLREAPTFDAIQSAQVPSQNGQPQQVWISYVREYSGDSLDAILSTNPDLAGHLPQGLQQKMSRGFVLKNAPRTDVLGVYTRALNDERRQLLKLPKEVGLDVVRVEPGTIASTLGISRGAVVIEVSGIEVRGLDGIRAALHGQLNKPGAKGLGQVLEVVWLDAWGQRQSRTWRGKID